jgi:hypothetical protein
MVGGRGFHRKRGESARCVNAGLAGGVCNPAQTADKPRVKLHMATEAIRIISMTEAPSSPRLTTALLEAPPDTSRLATCPLCHTRHASLTEEALQAGADWRCLRCGQRWDAARLAAVVAYADWAAEHDRVEGRRGSAARQKAAPFGNVSRNAAKENADAILTWDDEGGGSSSSASLSATA